VSVVGERPAQKVGISRQAPQASMFGERPAQKVGICRMGRAGKNEHARSSGQRSFWRWCMPLRHLTALNALGRHVCAAFNLLHIRLSKNKSLQAKHSQKQSKSIKERFFYCLNTLLCLDVILWWSWMYLYDALGRTGLTKRTQSRQSIRHLSVNSHFLWLV